MFETQWAGACGEGGRGGCDSLPVEEAASLGDARRRRLADGGQWWEFREDELAENFSEDGIICFSERRVGCESGTTLGGVCQESDCVRRMTLGVRVLDEAVGAVAGRVGKGVWGI